MAPPTISEKQTTQGLNRTSLMYLPAIRPTITAGRNATNTPMTNRRSSGLENMPSAIRHSFAK
jgi:hypothetical protein